uniref:Uncharacterized protein n=1 Tax=viral metagenome TaxID=1070528 RepID=A0A6H1ZK78_9ZZZZ
MVNTNNQGQEELKTLLTTHRAAFVHWVDPTSYSPWQSIADARELECMAQWSLGWITYDSPGKMVLALTLAHDHLHVADKIVLPGGCIKQIINVKI